jgi:hypothetical protein
MTVQRLRDEMSNEEFVMWSRYHAVISQSRELAYKKAMTG